MGGIYFILMGTGKLGDFYCFIDINVLRFECNKPPFSKSHLFKQRQKDSGASAVL